MSYACIKTDDAITVVNQDTGESHTVYASQKGYEAALDAVRAKDWLEFEVIARPATIFERDYCDGRVVLNDGVVSLDDREMHGTLTDRMVDMIQDGFDIEPLANFMVKLDDNPSHRAVTELYGFLEASSLAITPDGDFVAYKMVRDDYKDTYSGTMDNSPGEVVEVPRNTVDEDKDRTCSSGLHFCGRGYLGCYPGSRTIILKINPADVVSIPVDYNNHKGRCCKYEVIGELSNGYSDDRERVEEELEGSVFTGEGYDVVDDFIEDMAEIFNEVVKDADRDIFGLDDDDDYNDTDVDPINTHPTAISGTIHEFYSTRSEARQDARLNSNRLKFKDMGYTCPAGERWATIYK